MNWMFTISDLLAGHRISPGAKYRQIQRQSVSARRHVDHSRSFDFVSRRDHRDHAEAEAGGDMAEGHPSGAGCRHSNFLQVTIVK
jgi:hypothetical protein